MRKTTIFRLLSIGIAALFDKSRPVVGSIIVTDRCNLACEHCAVGDARGAFHPHAQIRADMQGLYRDGVRVLLFYGGEPFLWRDGDIALRDLVIEAKRMGFALVGAVTNGTLGLDLPEADLLLVSLDGGREAHNAIRGDTYDAILENIGRAPRANICLYMSINKRNRSDIEAVCDIAASLKNAVGVSYNFHTPYPCTEYLALDADEKRACAARIARLIDGGRPVLNLKSALGRIADNTFKTPCRRCALAQNGRRWVCGRCVDIEGLCERCGFSFAAELPMVFAGHPAALFQMLRAYFKSVWEV